MEALGLLRSHRWLVAFALIWAVNCILSAGGKLLNCCVAQPPAQFASAKSTSAPSGSRPTGPVQPTDLICVVGGDHVLAADVFAYIDNRIEKNRDRIPLGQEEALRQQMLRSMLVQYVLIKAQYQDFLREIIGNAPPTEAKEKRKQVETKANKLFFERQVPNLLKQYEVTDLRALEEKLRANSMSISQQQKQFMEMVLAGQAEERNVPRVVEVLRDELLEHYQAHFDQWQIPARARWRQLTARFDRHPNKAAAQQAIEAMGNEILYGGRRFEAVAKASSQGYTAPNGGLHDWTTKGALKSQPLDAAIFAIALNRLSQIIEDDTGFHIIEVLAREEASVTSFQEVQDKIRQEIIESKRQKLSDDYRKKVMDRTVIWTLWPEDIPGSRSLQAALEE